MVEIKILGIPESQKTLELTARVQAALEQLKLKSSLSIEDDLQKLFLFDINGVPALVINDKVVFQKELPTLEELIYTINQYNKKEKE